MTKPSPVFDIYESPLGPLYLLYCGKNLCGISFTKPDRLPRRKGAAAGRFMEELNFYFAGEEVSFSPQLRFLSGTEFEKRVWAAIREIPFGETRSYKWVAEKAGSPGAVRAAGQALGKNPIPIVVPCHRVIESNGSLGGYSSGIEIKRRLLDLEYYAKKALKPPRDSNG